MVFKNKIRVVRRRFYKFWKLKFGLTLQVSEIPSLNGISLTVSEITTNHITSYLGILHAVSINMAYF